MKFGTKVIRTCQENRVLVDVSHIGEQSFWDIIKISEKPIIASHSSVHKLCPHFRNLKNDQIEAIKKTNGFIGLNPYPYFIDSTFKIREEKFLRNVVVIIPARGWSKRLPNKALKEYKCHKIIDRIKSINSERVVIHTYNFV